MEKEYETLIIPMGRDIIELDGDERAILIGTDKIYYQTGVYCNYNEGTDECEPDFALTYFYKNPAKIEDYLYFEQDDPATAIHNLKNQLNLVTAPVYELDLEKLALCNEFVIRQLYVIIKQPNSLEMLMHRLLALGIITPMDDVLENVI